MADPLHSLDNHLWEIAQRLSIMDEHEPATLADAVLYGCNRLATQLKHLGLADAATPMGALEVVSVELKEGSQRLAEGLHAIADALRDVASALEGLRHA